MAEKVLATCRLQRCSIGYSDDTGEYEAGSCEADATHRITSPHDDRRWDYCEKCAREEHAKIEYGHRWNLWTIPGLEGFLAAQALARTVLSRRWSPSKVAEAVREACADALSRRVIPDDMSLAMARSAIHDLDLVAILARETVHDRIAYDMVSHNLIQHPLPWRVERDWTHEVTAADGTIITKCMTADHAAAVIAMAEQIRADMDKAEPGDAEVP